MLMASGWLLIPVRDVSPKSRSTMFSTITLLTFLRSEEHTSELQSPCNLVCRLLLEKKKKNAKPQKQTKQKQDESKRSPRKQTRYAKPLKQTERSHHTIHSHHLDPVHRIGRSSTTP